MSLFNDKDHGEIIHSLGNRTVVRYGEDKVVKHGRIDIREADTLRFVAANSSIPVPRVHAVESTGDSTAILMDFMPGTPLDKAWEILSSEQKIAVTRDLGSLISQIRRLKGSYIGAVNRGPAIVGRFSRTSCGPFENEKQFNDYLLSRVGKKVPAPLRHCTETCMKADHEITFTHGDLSPRNILVDDQGHVSAILDWEDAGWYPEYWEYFKAMKHLTPMPDWPDYFNNMLPPSYELEFIVMSYLSLLSID